MCFDTLIAEMFPGSKSKVAAAKRHDFQNKGIVYLNDFIQFEKIKHYSRWDRDGCISRNNILLTCLYSVTTSLYHMEIIWL